MELIPVDLMIAGEQGPGDAEVTGHFFEALPLL